MRRKMQRAVLVRHRAHVGRAVARVCVVAALVVLVAGCGPQAELVSEVDYRGITVATLRSPSLEDNLLGETPDKRVAVYLPPGYEETDRTYPVVYYLHGFGFSPTVLASYKPHFDEYFLEHPSDALVIAAVDGTMNLGASFWRNSPVTGNWADFAAEEVPAYIERTYRVSTEQVGKGLTGFSMGGNAALHLAFSRPEQYGAVFAVGPAIAPRRAPERFANAPGQPRRASIIATHAHEAVLTDDGGLDEAALEEAEITPEVVELSARRSGARAIDRMLSEEAAADSFEAHVRIEYGTRERQFIKEAVGDVKTVLEEHGVPHEVVEFDGGHALPASHVASVIVPYFARRLEP